MTHGEPTKLLREFGCRLKAKRDLILLHQVLLQQPIALDISVEKIDSLLPMLGPNQFAETLKDLWNLTGI